MAGVIGNGPGRSLRARPSGALLLALATLALASAPASAAITHDFLPEPSAKLSEGVPASSGAALPGPLSGVQAMTLDEGHLWIAENLEGTDSTRVDEFDASTGDFLSQFPQMPSLHALELGVAVRHPAGEETQVYVGAVDPSSGAGRVGVFDPTGKLLTAWTGTTAAVPPQEEFGQTAVSDVAVDTSSILGDWASGDVFVADRDAAVVDVFAPGIGGSEPPGLAAQLTGTCAAPGTCPGEVIPFTHPRHVAVSRFNGGVAVADEGESGASIFFLDIFKPAALPGQYEFVRQLTGTPSGPFHAITSVAVDGGDGDIYASDSATNAIDQFNAAGEYLGHLTATPRGPLANVNSVTVDSVSHDVYVGNKNRETEAGAMDVFGKSIVIPDVTITEPVSNLTATSATLHGTVNPDEAGEATCEFEYGTSASYGQRAPCTGPLGEASFPVPVESASLTALAPDTTYHYRLDATNDGGAHTNTGECPEDCGEFTTPGPGIRSESASEVKSTSATLHATIDPHGVPTSYRFEYDTSAYNSVASHGTSSPMPNAAIGSGETDVEVSRHVQNLSVATIYHYRVVAVSEPEGGQAETVDGADQTFTTQTVGSASALPDGRQWELVSPPNKHGALIEPIGEEYVTQAAASGAALAYITDAPTEPEPQGNSNRVQVLSGRGPAAWSSRDIAAAHDTPTGLFNAGGNEFRFFSEDLSLGMVQPLGAFTPALSPEASEQTAFLRTNYLNGDVQQICPTPTQQEAHASCFRPLVTGKPGYANVPEPGTAFGEEGSCPTPAAQCGPRFLGATPDGSHAVLTSSVPLTAGASEHSLYEWSRDASPPEQLKLISVLPNGQLANFPALGLINEITRRAVSDDGSRIVWSEDEGGEHLFMRDVALRQTVQLDAVQPGASGVNEPRPKFQAASNDGSRVFFTDRQRLTSNGGGGPSAERESDLYECRMVVTAGGLQCQLSDLTPVSSTGPAKVAEEVNVSDDGSYVYFVANGKLADGAVQGTCEGQPEPAALCNMYVWHNGSISLVAVLSAADYPAWNGLSSANLLAAVNSRVSPDGRWLVFMSQRALTGYDNRDAATNEADEEVYLYGAESDRLVCASCNPTGARPVGVEVADMDVGINGARTWSPDQQLAGSVPTWTTYGSGFALHQPRYLSNTGRMFFNSSDGLVPTDVNGTGDVYEFEPQGVGGCTSATSSESVVFVKEVAGQSVGGCVGLISSGTSSEESGFLDANEAGDDVFFFTAAQLSNQDFDTSRDVYDAHECTSAVPCFPTPAAEPPQCATADACRAAPSTQPSTFGAPSSATFSGPGNAPSPPRPVTKPKAAAQIRAEKLTKALRACNRKPKRKRAVCRAQARKKYGPPRKAKKSGKARTASNDWRAQ